MSGKASIRVGDSVRFQFGPNKIIGTVTELRGPIGVKGRDLYSVSFSLGDHYSSQVELPADAIELVKGNGAGGDESATAGKKAIRVGDRVRFQYGVETVTGTVMEDRGPIGFKGRNLYRIYSAPEPEFSFYVELPAEALEVVNEPVSSDEGS